MRLVETALAINATMNNQTLPVKSEIDNMYLPSSMKFNETLLPSLGANPSTVTVSGFSGGAFMAM